MVERWPSRRKGIDTACRRGRTALPSFPVLVESYQRRPRLGLWAIGNDVLKKDLSVPNIQICTERMDRTQGVSLQLKISSDLKNARSRVRFMLLFLKSTYDKPTLRRLLPHAL